MLQLGQQKRCNVITRLKARIYGLGYRNQWEIMRDVKQILDNPSCEIYDKCQELVLE